MEKLCSILMILTLVLLNACSSGSTTTPAVGTAISGAVSKGPVVNATVNVYQMNADGTQGALVVSGITTDSYGAWSANITVQGPFMVVATGGSYVDEYTGATIPLGTASLRSIMPAGATTAPISPITDAALLTVQQMVRDGYATDVTTALPKVQASYTSSFGFDPLTVIPPAPEQLATATAAQKQYAAVLGGISKLVNDAYTQIVTATGTAPAPLDLVNQMAADFAADGSIDGVGVGGQPVSVTVNGTAQPLNTVFAGGADIAAASTAYLSLATAAGLAGTTVAVTPINFTQTLLTTTPDTIAPVVTAPAAITVTAPAGTTSIAATDAVIAAFLNAATATDNIGLLGAITNDAPTVFSVGTTTVTFSARDGAGNMGTTSSTVTVNASTTGGTATLNVTGISPSSGASGSAVTITGSGFNSFLAVSVTFNGVTTPVAPTSLTANQLIVTVPVGATTGAIIVQGLPGGTAITTTAFTITGGTTGGGTTDTQNPVVTAPTNVSVLETDTAAITAFLTGATATDNVGVVGGVSNDAVLPLAVGAHVVTFTATDAAGNTGTATATITITAVAPTDTQNPVVTAPTNVSVLETDAVGITAFLTGATATDNVGVVGGVSNDAVLPLAVGAHVVTFTATDAAGNTGTATATITITAVTTGGGTAGGSGLPVPVDIRTNIATIYSSVIASFKTEMFSPVTGGTSEASVPTSPGAPMLVTEKDAAGKVIRVISYDAGPDGLWLTADDIVLKYNAFSPYGLAFTNPGADNIWFTADDVLTSGATFNYADAQGNNVNGRIDFGADGFVSVTDDTAPTGYQIFSTDSYGNTQSTNFFGAGVDGVTFTADDSIARIFITTVDVYGNARDSIGYDSLGADGDWFAVADNTANYYATGTTNAAGITTVTTYNVGSDRYAATADDTIQFYQQRKGTSSASSFSAGVDGVWFTADDPLSLYRSESTKDAYGNVLLNTNYNGVGLDGYAFTADDVISDYRRSTYNASNQVLTAFYGNGAGADGIWFTADDVFSGAYRNTYDVQGNLIKFVSYQSAGVDGIWFTADDVPDAYGKQSFDAQNRATQFAYYTAGIDGIWFNADDTPISYRDTTYDAQGGKKVVSYNGAGSDGVWFTTDDMIFSYEQQTVDIQGNQTIIKSNNAGVDGIWFTVDDVIASEQHILVNHVSVATAGNLFPAAPGCNLASTNVGSLNVYVTTGGNNLQAGTPLAGALVQLDQAGTVVTTDTYGLASFPTVNGNHDVHVFADNYSWLSMYCVQPNGTQDIYANLNPLAVTPVVPTVKTAAINILAVTGLDVGHVAQLVLFDAYGHALATGFDVYGSTRSTPVLSFPSDAVVNTQVTGDLYAIEGVDFTSTAYGNVYDLVLIAANQTFTVGSTVAVDVSINFTVPQPVRPTLATVTSTLGPVSLTPHLQGRWANGNDFAMFGNTAIAPASLPLLYGDLQIEANSSNSTHNWRFTKPLPILPATTSLVSAFANGSTITAQNTAGAINPTISWTPANQRSTALALSYNILAINFSSFAGSYNAWNIITPAGVGQAVLPTVPATIISQNLVNGTQYDLQLSTYAVHGVPYQNALTYATTSAFGTVSSLPFTRESMSYFPGFSYPKLTR